MVMGRDNNAFSHYLQYEFMFDDDNAPTYDANMSSIGENLKRELDAIGWNAYDLERACENIGEPVPQSTIVHYVAGIVRKKKSLKNNDPSGGGSTSY